MIINKQSFQENLTQIKEIGSMLLPKGKAEWLLFDGFALFYFSYSLVIGLYTSIVGNEHILTESYFSFDTSVFINLGTTGFTRHPMLQYFTAPFFFLGDDNFKQQMQL
jgi:hypothetical protein